MSDLNHPIVVVVGPNEAGKSTFFEFLVTMLYGFAPAEAGKHPYRSTDRDSLEGRLDFRTASSACSVRRTLRSTPKGSLSIGADGLFGSEEDLRNRPLQVVGDISRDVYRSVYALTLSDMTAVDGHAWSTVQDRLLGGLNLDYIRSTREVVEDLEREANRLWRSDRRGKTQASAIIKRQRALREDARSARSRDEAVRRMSHEIESTGSKIADLDIQRSNLKRALRQMERLVPLKRGLGRLEQLDAEAGDARELDGLPADPEETLADLASQTRQLRRTISKLEEEEADLSDRSSPPDDRQRRLLEHASAISQWRERTSRLSQLRLWSEETASQRQSLRLRIDGRSRALFSRELDLDQFNILRQLNVGELRVSVRGYRQLKEKRDRVEALGQGAAMTSRHARSPIPWMVLMVIGLLLVLIGIIIGQPAAWAPGIAVSAVGAAFVYSLLSERRGVDASVGTPALQRTEAELQDYLATIERLVSGLPLPATWFRDPDLDVIADLQTLQSALLDDDEVQRKAERIERELESETTELTEFLGLFEIESTVSPESELTELHRRLVEATRRDGESQGAKKRLQDVRGQLKEAREEWHDAEARRDALVKQVSKLGSGDVAEGVQIIRARREAVVKASAIRDQLETDFPDLESLVDQVGKVNGSAEHLDETRAELEERLDEIEQEIKDLHRQVGVRSARIDELLKDKSVADLESEALLVDEELVQVTRRRDRLALLARIIRLADARFRDKHQPDVIRLAASMISRLTSGRYDGLELDEDTGQLFLQRPVSGERVEVKAPLSRGTLDQVYLALRLAVADHLDAGGEPLPIFLDEVLVNWDESRRINAFRVLDELSAHRQVFFFTCHEWLAADIAEHTPARLVSLA